MTRSLLIKRIISGLLLLPLSIKNNSLIQETFQEREKKIDEKLIAFEKKVNDFFNQKKILKKQKGNLILKKIKKLKN